MHAFGIEDVASLLRGRRFVALTGAGVSTESGIPDYRGPETRRRARAPMQHREFVTRAEARRRYWARAVLGWERFRGAAPNAGHVALAELERAGSLAGVITQNVDGLHQRAGSARVVELHGALERVRCLECGALEPRASVHDRLLARNPGWLERTAALAPDGDADLTAGAESDFEVAPCILCGGVLKPDVVFFGGNCDPTVVSDAWKLFDDGEALLVVGSSLTVFSGYRFVRRAAERSVPIAMINLGDARGMELASARLDAKAGDALPLLSAALSTRHLGKSPCRP